MPQDKRLIITKAVLFKLQRLCHNDEGLASKEGLFLEFILPSVVLQQCPELLSGAAFHLPHRTFPRDGRTTCLIVPKVISLDCFKINQRHGYVDAVVTAEAISRRGDAESAARAAKVAKTFTHFYVDARIVAKLPIVITESVQRSSSSSSSAPSTSTPSAKDDVKNGGYAAKSLTAVQGLDERESLTFRLSQAATGSTIHAQRHGQLRLRVGHGGMTAGDVCDNAKCFLVALKKDYPTVWKFLTEVRLTSSKTDSIRFMEIHIQR